MLAIEEEHKPQPFHYTITRKVKSISIVFFQKIWGGGEERNNKPNIHYELSLIG